MGSTTATGRGATRGEAAPGPVVAGAGQRPGRWGVLFAVVWLVYLLQPAGTALDEPVLALRVLALVALACFALGFGVFFGWLRLRSAAGRPVPDRTVLSVIAVGAGLLALAEPAAGDEVLVGLVYLGVAAVMALPLRRAVLVVGALVAATLGLPHVVPGWSTQWDFLPELLLACFAAYGVGQVVLRNGQLSRAREQLVELAVTRERERLARDVHDILGHSLTVITVKSELLGRLLEQAGPEQDRARREVADLEQLARGALADVRATVAGTREVSLAGELAAARRALDSAGIEADLPGSVEEVPLERRTLFAWTLREGVTNVVRHSAARHCSVTLDERSLEVLDDGRGAAPGAGGTGLLGLRERADAAGARLDCGPGPDGGFRLRVEVP